MANNSIVDSRLKGQYAVKGRLVSYRMDAFGGLYCSRALTFLLGMSGGALRLPVRPLDI